jgi:diguanylate cyclase (GGDEF)-like protein
MDQHDASPDRPGTDTVGLRAVRRLADPTVLTLALAGLLLGGATALAGRMPTGSLLDLPAGTPTAAVAGALVVLFFLTELGQARIEIRRQAYSFSLSGVPLLLGLLFCPPWLLVAARLTAAVVAFGVQRVPPVKFVFNLAAYTLDVAAVLVLSHVLVPGDGHLGLTLAATCYLALAVVDVVMSGVILLVIRINGGPVGGEDVVEVLLSAGLFVALNTATGLIAALLVTSGSLGILLLVGVAGVAASSYRAYLVLRRRHRSLQDLQDFIRRGEGAPDVEDLAGRLLPQVQTLLHAGRAELTIAGHDGGRALVVRADEDGRITRATVAAGDPGDPGVPGDPGDVLVVPLDASGTRGSLSVADRLGDRTRFTDDDLALLRTLAGHLAVALHSVRLVERLRYEARHDTLTGLPNRYQLSERIRELISAAAGPERVSVLLLDLDRFKEVNDAFGHAIGDELLGVVAQRLLDAVPAGCTVGRLGGDEFAVVVPASSDPETHAVALAGAVARALAAPVHLSAAAVTTGACVGIAVAEPDHDDADLLRQADTAMYAAKAARTPVLVYTDTLDEGRRERLAMLVDMRAALDGDQFDVHYQPKIHIASGVATSVEALVRWDHPVLGRLSPDAFIPVAESTGIIDELTQVVLAKALQQQRRWRDAGLDMSVAVNLSARNVNDPDLPQRVAAALAAAGVPADRLILEITESSVMGDPEHTVPTLARLAAIGVTLSLDDFGTGYSSLSYLQRLPVRELKIDRSFLLGLADASTARASHVLVRSIVGLGRSLGLTVVAEGVETTEILDELRHLGCDVAQGYLVSRPVPGVLLPDAVERAGYRTPRLAVVPKPRSGRARVDHARTDDTRAVGVRVDGAGSPAVAPAARYPVTH